MSGADVSTAALPTHPSARRTSVDPSVSEIDPASKPSTDRKSGPVTSTEGDYRAEVDLRHLKQVARKLPDGDPARQLIEGEPDSLPLPVLAAKADSWVLLLLPRAD